MTIKFLVHKNVSFGQEIVFVLKTSMCHKHFTSIIDQCGTGQHGCSNFGEPICGEDSCCSDSLDAQYALPNAAACLTTCKGQINPTCAWYAYKNSTGICVTYRNLCKIKYDVGLGTCNSGESRCSDAGRAAFLNRRVATQVVEDFKRVVD